MTVTRVAVILVLIASGAVAVYGLTFDRTGQNLAFTVAGLAVFGITMAFVAAWFLSRALEAARRGRSGPALTGALLGGLSAILSAMALAAAAIFALLRGLG